MRERGSARRGFLDVAFVAAWLAFIAGLVLGGDIEDAETLIAAAAGGAALVYFGFAAAARCRVVSPPTSHERTRLAALSLVAGAGLGLANLAANWLIAASDPAIGALMIERLATRQPLHGLVASPLVEEITFRLFLMSGIAWAVSRVSRNATTAFGIALVASSLIFAVLHLERPMPDDPMLANSYRAMLVAKYSLTGVPLGWIFWRWGLPYAFVAHGAANGAHLVVQDLFF